MTGVGVLNARSGSTSEVAQEVRQVKRSLLARPNWFPALYPGVCGVCHQAYRVGDPITWAPGASTADVPIRWQSWCCS